MTRTAFVAAALVAAFLAMPAQAEDVAAGTLKISAPWLRATPKGATVGGGYFVVTNTGTTSDRLVGGSTDVAQRFEVHEMSMDNGVMKMRPIKGSLEIKPGETLTFKPGGYHIMLVGLTKPLEQGEHVKATLDFEKAGKVAVDFTVEGIGAQGPGAANGAHGGAAGIDHGGMQMKH